MITEERVMQELAKSNPVPNLDAIELVELKRPIYLATLELRSRQVTNTKLRPRRIDPDEGGGITDQKRWSGSLWLAAAIVAILLGTVGYLIVRNQAPVSPDDNSVATIAVDPANPVTAIERYFEAYNAGDLDGVVALFTEESEIINHPYSTTGSIAGLEAIRTFQNIDMTAGADQNAYTISNMEVSGDTVTWDHVWVDRNGSTFCKRGMEAVIRDGKILSFVWPDTQFGC